MLTIYRASAGSGKTFTLTGFYLRLAFEHPQKYREILAVTFTNKAAAEMKSRIVEELSLLAAGSEKAQHRETLLEAYPNFDADSLKHRAADILRHMLHNYSDFAVSTIDSFVQRVLKAFTYEIGLHQGYAIEFDSQKIIRELIQKIFTKLGEDPFLLDWLRQFAEDKIEGGKHWDIRGDIARFSEELFKENLQRQLDSDMPHRELMQQLENLLTAHVRGFEDAAKAINAQCLRYFPTEPAGIPAKVKHIYNYLANKIVGNKASYEPNKTVAEALNSIEGWMNKTTKQASIQEYYDKLNPLLVQMNELMEQGSYARYLLAGNIRSKMYVLGIMLELNHMLPEVRNESNSLHISESNHLLKRIVGHNDAPYIYEKTGSFYSHILIDEFQDTSTFQWENFRPLLTNMLAQGNEGLLVGDIKQAIYRWRGGDWKLLLEGVKRDIPELREEVLEANYRSLPNIVHFNNYMFRHIAAQIAIRFGEPYHSQLINAYSDIRQEVGRKNATHQGNLELRFFDAEVKSGGHLDWRGELATILPERINQLLDGGYVPSNIAILTRRNSDSAQVVEWLMAYMEQHPESHQYAILSSDALNIHHSAPVRMLLSAMHLLLNPNDLLSISTLAELSGQAHPTAPHGQTEIEWPEWLANLLGNESQLNALRQLPLFELVNLLTGQLQLLSLSGASAYIRTFEDVIVEYTRNQTDDLSAFLLWWPDNAHKFSLQVSESENALRILTLHKSKGLAFDVVFVPFADWQLSESHPDSLMWLKIPHGEYQKFPVLPVAYKKELQQTVLETEYQTEHFLQHVDALNMLYVAFTRAREALIVWAPKTEAVKDDSNRIADTLLLAMQQMSDDVLPDTDTFAETGNLYQTGSWQAHRKTEAKTEHRLNTQLPHLANWRQRLSLKQRSEDFFIRSIKAIAQKVNYGSLMHQMLARLHKLDDLPELLHELRHSGRLGPAEYEVIANDMQQLILRPTVQHWYEPQWQVRSEQGILTANGELFIPDRILENEKQILVIDFKFGEPRPEHHTQVLNYMQLVASINPHKPVSGALYYAATNTLTPVK